MKAILTVILACCVAFASASVALAGETYTWDGSSSTAWTTAANWSGGTFATYPDDAGDKAIITNQTNDPVVNANIEVGIVDIQSGQVTIPDGGSSFRTLTIDNTNGLSVAAGAFVYLEYDAKLILEGGGDLVLNGNIEFVNVGSRTADPVLHLLEATAIPDSGSGDINAAIKAVITADDADSVLVLGAGHDVNGTFDIEAPLVNNGRLLVDGTDEKIHLKTYAKTGNGDYEITGSGAIIEVDVPVSGGAGSGLTMSTGTLDVDYYFILCGELDMTGGVINVDANAMFEMSGCP